MNKKKRFFIMVSVLIGLVFCNCNLTSDPDYSPGNSGSTTYDPITVTPPSVTLSRGETQKFSSDISYVTWSLSGASGNSSINSSGLLTVGADETSSTLTVTASKSNYIAGKATVTVPAPSETPQGLKASKPAPKSIALSWQTLSGAGEYTVYRSVNGTAFGQIGTTSDTSFTDPTVSEGSYYYYRISAKGVNSNIIFAYAGDHFNMPTFANKKTIPLDASAKHYYRFAVTAGTSYTIEWQDGNNQNTPYSFLVTAYQNNGTQIFSRGKYSSDGGYTNPSVFTATVSGFVTVEVFNNRSTSQDYQIYFYGSEAADSGTAALPPYQVSSFRVSASSPDSIYLGWDTVSDAAKYTIYRSNTQIGAPSRIGESNTANYTDIQVSSGMPYWYTIAAVNADGREGCRFQGAFGYAASHYTLLPYNSAQTLSLDAAAKHYYRFAVTAGSSYTIEWQDGNNQNTPYSFLVTAYQNNGTQIFSRGKYSSDGGYTNPSVFTATASGFVTVEVFNNRSTSQDYQIYRY